MKYSIRIDSRIEKLESTITCEAETSAECAILYERVLRLHSTDPVPKLDEPASPHVTTEAEWRKGYEVLEQRVRDFQNDATRFRDELAKATTERDVWKQAAINAQGPTLAADLQACRDAAEKLKAELEVTKVVADAERRRAEAAEAKLLTPDEAKEIQETYRIYVWSKDDERARPDFYTEERDIIDRATRPA